MVKFTKLQSFSWLSFWLFAAILYKEKEKKTKKQLQNEIDLSNNFDKSNLLLVMGPYFSARLKVKGLLWLRREVIMIG